MKHQLFPGFIATSVLAFGPTPPGLASAAEERVDHRTQAALAMDAHPMRGAELYSQYCSRCHGENAPGDAAKLVPSLAGQRFVYLVRQLANFAGSQRDSTTMHGIATRAALDDPQRWVDIAAYLNRLPPSTHQQVGAGDAVNLGRGIYHEQCASCHGADASGDKEGYVPTLRHQHYGYLEKQMHSLAAGSRHNVDEELVLFMRSFDERDMRGTADFLSRLEGPDEGRKTMREDGVVVN